MSTTETSQSVNGHALPDLPLTEIQGEPRALDLDIAKRLGFARPRSIRQTIERHKGEIEAFGPLATVCGKSRGQAFVEYWLNEEQALLVATVSEAENAPAVRAMLIRVFVAWRRGHIGGAGVMFDGNVTGIDPGVMKAIGGMVKGILERQLRKVVPDMVENAILEGGHVVSTDFKPALEVLKDCKVPARKRRAFSQRVSSRLRRFSTESQFPLRLSRETGRYLFHVEAITKWLMAEGNGMIQDHMAALSGQGVLHLVTPRKTDPKGGAA